MIRTRTGSPPVDRSREPEVIWGSVGLLLLGLGAGVALMPRLAAALPHCIFKGITGIPCPTCGATRAGLALLAGHPLEALLLNPLVGGALLAGLVYLPYAWLVSARRLKPVRTGWLTPPVPVTLRLGIVAALLANWAYVIAAGR